MNKLLIAVTAILVIGGLEAINMIWLKHNGAMLLLVVTAIAGIAGFKLGQNENPK